MVNAQHVTKKYDDFKALDDLSLEVNRGGAWALLGPNGAGKTTFLKCLLGLKEFNGVIQIDGIDIQQDPKKAKSLIGYVPQHPALYDDLSVQEELRYFGDMRDVKRARVRELIEFVGLEAWARQPVGALSGGMKQRLMLAVALLSDPPVLLLDEPTANLDVRRQLEFRNLIKLLVEEGKTVVLTTHYMEEAAHLCDRLVIMHRGKILTEGRPHDLIATHVGEYVLELRLPDGERDRLLSEFVQESEPNFAVEYVEDITYVFGAPFSRDLANRVNDPHVANLRLGNMCAVVDWNGSAATLMPRDDLYNKWKSFGWNTNLVDGHNLSSLDKAFKDLKFSLNDTPNVLIAKTIKGRGVSFIEGHGKWHHKIPSNDEMTEIMKELKS